MQTDPLAKYRNQNNVTNSTSLINTDPLASFKVVEYNKEISEPKPMSIVQKTESASFLPKSLQELVTYGQSESKTTKTIPNLSPTQQRLYEEEGNIVPNKYIDAYHPIRDILSSYDKESIDLYQNMVKNKVDWLKDYTREQRASMNKYINAISKAKELVQQGKYKFEDLPEYMRNDMVANTQLADKLETDRLQQSKEIYDKIQNPVGKLLERTSRVASNALMADNYNYVPEAQNKVDIVSDVIGTIMGYAMPIGGAGTGTSQLNVANNIAGTPVERLAQKGLSKLGNGLLPKVAKTVLPMAARGAAEGASLGTYQGVAQGLKPDEIAQKASNEALWGAVLDPALIGGGKLLGKAGQFIIEKLNAGKLEKITESIKDEIQVTSKTPTTGVKSFGKFKIKNTLLENTINEYNDAIETIQNYFKTNELRVDEMNRIKPELGIDLDILVKNIEDANGGIDIKKLGERSKMAQVAGVKNFPNFNFVTTPTKPASTNLSNIDVPTAISNNIEAQNIPSQLKAQKVKNVEIPSGEVERGFSKNIRTDYNMNDEIRDSFTDNPLSYKQLSNKETLDEAMKIYNNGFQNALNEWNRNLGTFRAQDVPLAKMLANDAAKNGDIELSRKIIADVADKLTQAGQFSQAARILRQSEPGGFLTFMQRQLNKLNEDGLNKYKNKWKEIQLTDDEIKQISSMDVIDDESKEVLMESLYKRISEDMPSTFIEKFNSWRRIAMLLNPKTHLRNLGGNTLMSVMRKTSDTIGAGLENVFLKSGQRTKSINWKSDDSIIKLVNDNWESNKKDLLDNNRWELNNISFLNRDKRVFQNDLLNKLDFTSKDLLNKGDIPFYKNAYTDSLGQYLKANNLNEVTQEAQKYAKRRAEEATFKQTDMFSTFIQNAKRKGGIIGTSIEAAIPFTKTPTNILMRSIEYSPAGLMKALYSKANGKTADVVIEELSKGLTGTGILALGFWLRSMGWARGEKASNKNVEGTLQQMGQQSNSIITPLGSYTFDWAQPFAVPLAMGIAVYDSLSKSNSNIISSILDATAAGGDTIFNMSMMQNIKDFLGGGFSSPTEAIMSLPADYVEQAFPTAIGQTAKVIDTTRRNTYDPNPVKQFTNTLISKTPFASKTLQPKLDIWGNEQTSSTGEAVLQQFLSPGYAKEKSNDPVTQEILRLYNNVKENDMLPKIAPYSVTVKGKKIELAPEEITQFQREMGNKNYNDIKTLINSTDYKLLSDTNKSKKIMLIVKDNYDMVKEKIINR